LDGPRGEAPNGGCEIGQQRKDTLMRQKWWVKHGAAAAAAAAEEEEGGGQSKEWTTIMLRNLPNKFTSDLLTEMLNNQGYNKRFDYIYLPIDFRNRCNMGYAFVNFRRGKDAKDCKDKLVKFKDWKFIKSNKLLETSYADVQGFEANVERFRKSNISSQDLPEDCKPLIFENGHRIDIKAVIAERAKYGKDSRWQTGAPDNKTVAKGVAAAKEATDDAWNSWDSWEGGGKASAAEARPTGWYKDVIAERAKYGKDSRWQTGAPGHKTVAKRVAAAWEETDEARNSWDSWEGGGKASAAEARPTEWYEEPAHVDCEAQSAKKATEEKWQARDETQWKHVSKKDGWQWSEAGAEEKAADHAAVTADGEEEPAAEPAIAEAGEEEKAKGGSATQKKQETPQKEAPPEKEAAAAAKKEADGGASGDEGTKKPGEALKEPGKDVCGLLSTEPEVPAALARYQCPFCGRKFAKWSACAGHFTKDASCRLQVLGGEGTDIGSKVESMQEKCRLQEQQANIV